MGMASHSSTYCCLHSSSFQLGLWSRDMTLMHLSLMNDLATATKLPRALEDNRERVDSYVQELYLEVLHTLYLHP